jgi:hypothetical protein
MLTASVALAIFVAGFFAGYAYRSLKSYWRRRDYYRLRY